MHLHSNLICDKNATIRSERRLGKYSFSAVQKRAFDLSLLTIWIQWQKSRIVSVGTMPYSQGLTKGQILLFLHYVLGGRNPQSAHWSHSSFRHSERLVAKQREALNGSSVSMLPRFLLYAQNDSTSGSGQEHYEEEKKGAQTEQLQDQRGNILLLNGFEVLATTDFL